MAQSDNPRHKKSLLDIPPEGATASTMARIWGVSAEVASTILHRYKHTLLYRFRGKDGIRYWKRIPDGKA